VLASTCCAASAISFSLRKEEDNVSITKHGTATCMTCSLETALERKSFSSEVLLLAVHDDGSGKKCDNSGTVNWY